MVFQDDNNGGFDDDLDKLVKSSVSTIFCVLFFYTYIAHFNFIPFDKGKLHCPL
jgi:hypothetical protein